jgi:hypothetical protein
MMVGRASVTRKSTAHVRSPLPQVGRGQAVVELAITLPILLLLLIGIINLGVLINNQIILTQAAWEGARAGVTLDPSEDEGDAEIIGAVRGAMRGATSAGQVLIEIDPNEQERGALDFPGPRGEPLEVRLSLPLHLALPFPATVTLKAQATSRIEYSNPAP